MAEHIHNHETHPAPPDWQTVEEKCLPDGAFANGAKRGYAHHHVDGATMQDDAGHYMDGKMYLHASGAKCAWMNALADGGDKEAVNHLADHAFALAGRDGRGESPIATPGVSGMGRGVKGVLSKSMTAEIAQAHPLKVEAGYIEGYAAIFGNVDSQGERVVKGAFAKTIRERIPTGKVKLMTTHLCKGGGTMQVIGTVTQAKEDDIGLWIHADLSSDATSQEARAKAAEGHVTGLSIGYSILGKAENEVDGEIVMDLTELKLLEVTLTPFPANELAEVTSAKSQDGAPAKQPATATVPPVTVDTAGMVRRRRWTLMQLQHEECEHG